MGAARTNQPRGTNQYDYTIRPFPFTPKTPFAAAGLGVAAVGALAVPGWDTYGHLVAPSLRSRVPVAAPADCKTAGGWFVGPLEDTDLVELTGFAVGYTSGATTAYSDVTEDTTYGLSIWAVRNVQSPPRAMDGSQGALSSFIAIPACRLTLTAGPLVTAGDTRFPGAAQQVARMIKTITVDEDFTLDPGVRKVGDNAAGVAAAIFDLRGNEGLIVYPHSQTDGTGLGLLVSGL